MNVWDKIAERWSQFRQEPLSELEDFRRRYAAKSGKVLDVGCGNCRNLLAFNDCSLFGIDKSAQMIEQAHEFADRHDLDIQLEVGDMVSLPYSDGFFDYVLSLASLHHLGKPARRKAAIEEMYRVLKKGGVARVSVWQELPGRQSFIKWGKYKRYYYKFSLRELKSLLNGAGFEILDEQKDRNLTFVVRK